MSLPQAFFFAPRVTKRGAEEKLHPPVLSMILSELWTSMEFGDVPESHV